MPFLDYFRCYCCKKNADELPDLPPETPIAVRTHPKGPTMVSYDFERAVGARRAFDALPEKNIQRDTRRVI
jgi:hypothetical protein